MNPNHLRQLAMVINAGSITRASDLLNLSQPALSRSLQVLEQQAGGALLNRTRHGVIPTELGAELGQLGEKILRETRLAQRVSEQWRAKYRTEIQVGIDPLWELAHGPQIIASMNQAYPGQLHLRAASASTLVPLLKEGELDLLLGPRFLSLDHSQLHSTPVYQDRVSVFVGKQHPLYGQNRCRITDLPKQGWLMAGADAGFAFQLQPEALELETHLRFTGSLTSLMQLLRDSAYACWLPHALSIATGLLDASHALELIDYPTRPYELALWSTGSLPRTLTDAITEFGHAQSDGC